MESTILADVQLNGAILNDVDLTLTSGLVAEHLRQPKSMFGANFRDSRIFGDLSKANLTRADLAKANLTRVNFKDVRWFAKDPPLWPSGFDPPENSVDGDF